MLVKVTNRSKSPGYVFNTHGHQVDCPPGVSVEVDMTADDVTHLLRKNGRMSIGYGSNADDNNAVDRVMTELGHDPAAFDNAPLASVSGSPLVENTGDPIVDVQAAGDDAETGDTDAATAEAEQAARSSEPEVKATPEPAPEPKNKFAKRPKTR